MYPGNGGWDKCSGSGPRDKQAKHHCTVSKSSTIKRRLACENSSAPTGGCCSPDCSFRFQGEAMDQIQAMRIFVRVVEAGTFTRAADSLSL
ncbi:MAG: LysR family transcriptional regulator, partial [Acidovorax sp.]